MDAKDIERRVRFLRKVLIFEESPDSLLERIAESLTEMEVSEGENIVLKGELGDSMYIILDGRVKVHDHDYIFTVLKSGDVFGKYYLLDKEERSATVTALSHTFLLRFDQDEFHRITENENTVFRGILKALVRRLRDMNVIEEQLAAQNNEILFQKDTLEKQKQELIDLNATKDKFFSIIAHDLRSPISTLISLSEVLRTDMDLLEPLQQKEILESLHDLSRNYLKLLDNLLQWSRVQSGRMVPEPTGFDLAETIRDVLGFYQPYALDKQIRLVERNISSVNVFADKNMIRVVLRNLISNAIKFTQPGGEIHVILLIKDNLVEVIIQDNGLGMPPGVLDGLFKLDKTQSSKGTAGERGTGLGLHLCKEFVELNKGAIRVESQKGFGSIFTFTIPKPS
ncbi:MAG: ATP-binding protein [Bacteroidetes bacterium]|nr:ATP-binding protein [Bacteroidota bacterium]